MKPLYVPVLQPVVTLPPDCAAAWLAGGGVLVVIAPGVAAALAAVATEEPQPATTKATTRIRDAILRMATSLGSRSIPGRCSRSD